MARKRQARRCRARRSDGQHCKGWAVPGCTVCSAHGGNAPRVRATGLLRYWEAKTTAAFDEAWERLGREQRHWQAGRILAAADILGIEIEEVHAGHLLWLACEGQIPGEADVPKLRVDRRYGPRTRAQLATRAARQAGRKPAAEKASRGNP